MSTPRAVKKAAEESERLVKQLNEPQKPNVAETPQPPAPEPTPSPSPAGEPPPAQPVGDPPVQPQELHQPTDESWQQRYQVLQGKYNAEVPRLSRQVAELVSRSEQLETLLAGMRASPASAVTPPASTPASKVTAEERAEWGPEFFDVVTKHVNELLVPVLSRLEGRMHSIEGGVQNVAQRTVQNDRDKLYQHLDSNVSGWRELNEREDFLQWLDQRDAYSGTVRGVLLKQAFERNDGERVAQFFKGFTTEHAIVAPSGGPTSNTPVNGAGTVDLASLAAPGRPAATPALNPNGAQTKRTWTQAQISQFYSDVRKGVFKNRQPERDALERDIVAAQSEGRLR